MINYISCKSNSSFSSLIFFINELYDLHFNIRNIFLKSFLEFKQ